MAQAEASGVSQQDLDGGDRDGHGSSQDTTTSSDFDAILAASNRMVSRQIGQHQIPISHSALGQHRGVRWCWTCGNYVHQHGQGLLK